MVHYGREDCEHVWRYRIDGWVEECVPTICIECGAFGCLCDLKGIKPDADKFFQEGYKADANPNGKWKNPDVKPIEISNEKNLENKLI